MISTDIPGFGPLTLAHLVCDFNGTLALDGILIEGVAPRLQALAQHLKVHVVTADTFGSARSQLEGLPVTVHVIGATAQAEAKLAYIQSLDAATVAAVGNGRNDRAMLQAAALGLLLVQREGAAAESFIAADLVCTHACDALDLLLSPTRLAATLRS